MEVTSIIVARGGSVRVPNKALREINGESLLARKIRQLKNVQEINRIVVGSDSDEILNVAESLNVEPVKRPDLYCDERVSSANDMIGNMMSLIDTDFVAWTHCTNPFISEKTYSEAIRTFFQVLREGYDSLLSVASFQEHLWSNRYQPINYNPYAPIHTLAKDLPRYFIQDGSIFIQSHKDMSKNSYFFGKKPYLFEIPAEEYLDINTIQDLKIANTLDDPSNFDKLE